MPEYKIIMPSKPRVVSEDGNKGVFEIDGLYPGYGHTLGNSLRRIILSSLPGASITSIKIDPEYLPGWFQVGHVAALSGTNLERGEAALRKYLAYVPKRNEPVLYRAHYWLGRSAQASPSGRCPPCSDLPLAGEAPTSPEQDDPPVAFGPDHPFT